MIEGFPKLSEVLKTAGLPLFLLTAFNSVKRLDRKEKKLINEDKVPGDNFPHVLFLKEKKG